MVAIPFSRATLISFNRPSGLSGGVMLTSGASETVPSLIPSSSRRTCRLPDLHAILRPQIELVAFLHAEGRIPGVEIAHRQCAILRRRVAVGEQLLAQRRLSRLQPPGLRIRDEELLVAGIAAELGPRL